jgi:hypothetical protein
MMWRVERQKKSLVSTNYIDVYDDDDQLEILDDHKVLL